MERGGAFLNRKIVKLFQPSMRLYFMVLVLFAVLTFFFEAHSRYLAIGEVVIVVLLGVYTWVSGKKRTHRLLNYIESFTDNMDSAAKNSLINFPMPTVIDVYKRQGLYCGDSEKTVAAALTSDG